MTYSIPSNSPAWLEDLNDPLLSRTGNSGQAITVFYSLDPSKLTRIDDRIVNREILADDATFQAALRTISSVAQVSFEHGEDNSSLVFAKADMMTAANGGESNGGLTDITPDEEVAQKIANAEVYMTNNYSLDTAWGKFVFLHETLHALGLRSAQPELAFNQNCTSSDNFGHMG